MKVVVILLVGAILVLAACAGRQPVDLLNALTPKSTYTVTTGLPYGDGQRRMLDVYQPTRQPTHQSTQPDRAIDDPTSGTLSAPALPREQKRPIVVFFYGGSWQNGQRSDYRFVGEALASRGFVVVVPDYRTYPSTIFPGFIDDAAAAVRWAHDHAAAYGADPSTPFLMGHSAGAQMAALLATDPRYLRTQGMTKQDIAGFIGLAGPYDFLPLRDATLKRIFPASDRADSQPINFISGDEPPMFLGVGKADTTVDPGNTDRFAARLTARGDVVEVKHYAGIGHALLVGTLGAPLRRLAPTLNDVSAFIAAHSDPIQAHHDAPASSPAVRQAA